MAFEESSTAVKFAAKTKYFLLVFLLSVSAFATGAKDGGGGGVVVCTLANGSKEARLLDMIEESGITSVYKGTYRSQVSHIIQKMRNQGYYRLAVALEGMLAFKLVSRLPVQPNDAGSDVEISPGCSLRWAAYFDDARGELSIDQYLFATLPEDDRAALLVHEAIYRLARISGPFEDNSRRVRSTVRLLMQNRNLAPADLFNRILR